MHYAGLLVITRPGRVAACIEQLSDVDGVEVHQTDPEEGRIVVVQEAPTVGAQRDGLSRVQGLSEVVVAELVYHYIDDDDEPPSEGAPEPPPA